MWSIENVPYDVRNSLKSLLLKMTTYLKFKVVDAVPAVAPRAIRRRLKKGTPQAEDMNRTRVNIVRWRKVRHGGRDGDGKTVGKDFCYQVTGHIRRQYYPSTKKHHPRWIDGYLKRNLNAQLRQSTTINVVDR